VLLIERNRLVASVELDPQAVLAPGRDLADDERAQNTPVRLEVDDGRVLGRHATRVCRSRPGREGVCAGLACAFGQRRQQPRRETRDALA
jgi:hypothetical protein